MSSPGADGIAAVANLIGGFLQGGGAVTGNDQPGFHLGSRLTAGLLSANEGFGNLMDQENKISDGGKAADAFREFQRKGDDDEAPMGIHDAQWNNMGARQKIATWQGFQQKQSMAQLMQQQAFEKSRAAYFNQRGQLEQAQADQDNADQSADKRFASTFTAATTPQMQPAGPGFSAQPAPGGSLVNTLLRGVAPAQTPNPNGRDILGMMLRAGVRPEKIFSRVNGINAMTGDGSDNTAPTQVMIGDVPYVWKPGSKEFQPRADFVPGLKNQDVLDQIAARNAGKGTVTAADRFKQGAAMHAARVKQAASALQFQSPGTPAYQDAQKQFNDATTSQESFLNGQSEALPVMNLPMNAGKVDPTQMKAGYTYQTKYGPATWDGKQFTSVNADDN